MEAYILNCDFSRVTDDTNNEFRESLDSYQEELSSLDYAGILSILKIFQNKVCVRGFPAVNCPGYSLADSILTTILQAHNEKAEENKLSSEESDECLLDLYVDLLKSGPGSGHCELLLTISKQMTFQDLNGNKLRKFIGGFKAISYVEEGDVSTYINTLEQVYPDQLSTIVIGTGDKDRLMSAEVHQALMELFVFYLIQLPHVPETLRNILKQAQETINEAYEGEPFSRYHLTDEIHQYQK